MNTIRRTVAFLTGLALSGLASLLAMPAVYAMTVEPLGGSGGGTGTAAGSGGGMAGWEIALVSVAALVFLAASATVVQIRLRLPRRSATA